MSAKAIKLGFTNELKEEHLQNKKDINIEFDKIYRNAIVNSKPD